MMFKKYIEEFNKTFRTEESFKECVIEAWAKSAVEANEYAGYSIKGPYSNYTMFSLRLFRTEEAKNNPMSRDLYWWHLEHHVINGKSRVFVKDFTQNTNTYPSNSIPAINGDNHPLIDATEMDVDEFFDLGIIKD